ncbi:MAG TPA: bifunctional hydroxymethylpyrimidine kinase/phosphomethylpyrimidine kinase, partial [Spirochaetota bacterium]|nr:bifunctional hydroxymethylpyrimidine kinase/phosphomethylpyrimidine kinase [Spirochaetota bacterium]
ATQEAALKALAELAAMGCENVLVKGGHLESGDSDDTLYLGSEGRVVTLPGGHIKGRNV